MVSFASGCSFLTELFVFNKSKHTVAVRFSFEPRSRSEEGASLTAYKITGWNNNLPEIGDTVKVYARPEGDSVWYAELPSNCALVIASDLNLDLQNEVSCKQFLCGLIKLEVLSPNDANFTCADTLCYSRLITLGKARGGFVIE